MAVSVGTMELTFSMAIMQVPTSVAFLQVLRFYCNFVGGTFYFCYTYVGGSFSCSYKVTVSVAIMQLEISATLMRVKVSPANIWVTIFIEIMQVGVC